MIDDQIDRKRHNGNARTYPLIALGGAIGALCRHGVSVAANDAFGHAAVGTVIANISGAFLLGLFLTLAGERTVISLEARRFVAVGILGSYTTFSTLSYQTWDLIESGNIAGASANAAGSLIAGLLSVAAGVALGRRVS